MISRGSEVGIVCAGAVSQHVLEGMPEASVFKLGCTWPLPENALREFAASVDELHQKPLWRELLRARVFRRCIVIRSNGGARSYEVGDLPCSD